MTEANISANKQETNTGLNLENLETKKTFRDYLFFFSGQQLSLLGSSIVSFAIIWWITITTQSEMMLGIASLVSLGPYVIVAPFSGILADKFNRKALLIAFDALQAVGTLTLSILFLTNHVTVAAVFIILGIRGIGQAFHQPVSMAVAPTMVPANKLSRINGLSYLFSGVINIIGPAVGAALLSIPGINIGMILWIDVATFGLALIPLLIIKIPSVIRTSTEEKQSFILQLTEGISAMKKTKGMLALLFGAMLINFFTTPLLALLPLFVNKTHMGTEGNYALVIGMLQAAVVVGGLVMSFMKGVKRPVLLMLGSTAFMFICQAVLAFIPTNFDGRFWTIGSVLFLFALPISVVDVVFITSIQLMVPKEKLGRAIAAVMAIAPAIRPLGQFLSGVIAEYTSIQILFIVASAIGIVVVVLLWFLTPIKLLDKQIIKAMNDAHETTEKESSEPIFSEKELVIEEPISERKTPKVERSPAFK